MILPNTLLNPLRSEPVSPIDAASLETFYEDNTLYRYLDDGVYTHISVCQLKNGHKVVTIRRGDKSLLFELGDEGRHQLEAMLNDHCAREDRS